MVHTLHDTGCTISLPFETYVTGELRIITLCALTSMPVADLCKVPTVL
jgi:hypothetical protein